MSVTFPDDEDDDSVEGETNMNEEEQEDFFPEADVFPSSGNEREYKTKVEDWLSDSSYMELNAELQARLFHRFYNDPSLRTVTAIYQSTLFSGGVLFTRSDKQLTEEAANFYNATWSQYGSSLDAYQSVLGYAPCTSIPHDEYVETPTCLQLSMCTTLYKQDVYGKPHFVFLENLDPMKCAQISKVRKTMGRNNTGIKQLYKSKSYGMSADRMYRYIPNVVVYCDIPPDTYGNFRSKVSVLSADQEMDDIMTQCAKTAMYARAHPMLITQSVQQKHDEEQIISTIQPMSMMLGNGTGPADPSSSSSSSSDGSTSGSTGTTMIASAADSYYNALTKSEQIQHEMKQLDYARLISSIGLNGMQKADQMARAYMQQNVANGIREYALQEGQSLATQRIAEGPFDFLLHFRPLSEERVFNLHGVPKAMISQTSSTGGRVSMNENAFVVFTNTQKQKKIQLIAYMKDMYHRIYFRHHGLHKLKSTPSGQMQKQTTKASTTNIEIMMPGMPNSDVITTLYTMGALKWEAFVQYQSAGHNIPVHLFNTTCIFFCFCFFL